MIKQIKTSIKLYLLVFVMSVFMIGVGFFGIISMKRMSQNTQTLHADRVLPLQQLTQIRYSYIRGILVSAEELENNSVKRNAAKNTIDEAEKNIAINWDAYKSTYLIPEEDSLVKQTIILKKTADKAIADLKLKIEKDDNIQHNDLIDEQLYAAINPVINNLNELIQLQIDVSDKLYKSNNTLYQSTKIKSYILILAALLLGGVIGFFIISDNRKLILDLKESNTKIKQAEEKCRAFIKYAGDAIFIYDEGLQIIDVNDSACNLLGYTYSQLLQMRMPDILAENEYSKFISSLEVVKTGGGSLYDRKLKRKNSTIVDTEVNVKLLHKVGYISIVRDITERKKAALAIKESEEKYRYLFQNNPACIIIWDLESLTVLEVNDVVFDKYKYKKE